MAIQIGTVLDGKYEILKQIGKGGMSIVYLAMDRRLNKQWAVKEISRKGFGKNHEEVINEVPRDAEMMKALDHPAIPTIVDIIDHRDSDYIYVVMDYVEGESLDKVLDEYGAQPQDAVIDWAKQICDALGYLHSQKPPIIYRDMKPANIMLKPEGNIKIIDFGIAREYKEGNLADTTVLGTKGYASPEHYGGRQTDERSDIYTLGMTMHHLLTGVDPRTPDYLYAPIRQWNPELSEGIERIIDKCVSPDPKDRYQNCNELLYALDHYTEEEASFKQKQRRKLFSFVISISLAIVFAISGFVTLSLAINAQSNNYNELIQINNLSYAQAQENIEKATSIDKKDIRAYQSFRDYIAIDENISDEEAQGMSTFVNKLKSSYPQNQDGQYQFDEEFGVLCLQIGLDHFCYYNINSDGVGASSMRDRALKALNYFEIISNSNLPDQNSERFGVATSFYDVCSFYKSDQSNSVKDKNYVEEYQKQLKAIDQCISYMDTYKGDDSKFIRAAVYKSAVDFIYANLADIAKYGKVEKDTLFSLFDTIAEKNDAIGDIKDENSRAYQTKKYVTDRVKKNSSYRQQIEALYDNLSR